MEIANRFKENSCSCNICKSMCKSPCIGTPQEILNIIEAGHGDKLSLTQWAVGILLGTHEGIIPIVAPTYNEKTGFCSFYKDGLCELHSLGLKPTEGRFASCDDGKLPIETMEEVLQTPALQVINEWEILYSNLDEDSSAQLFTKIVYGVKEKIHSTERLG